MNQYIDSQKWCAVVNSLNTQGYHVPSRVANALLNLISNNVHGKNLGKLENSQIVDA